MPLSFEGVSASVQSQLQSSAYWGSIIGIAVGYYAAVGKSAPTNVMIALPVGSLLGKAIGEGVMSK
jgi:hypothetical protein